jgi:hypothetical protein
MTDAELLAALATAGSPYLRALGRLGQLQADRDRQYNTKGIGIADYFPLGRASYYTMLHIKCLRARSTIDKDAEFNDSIMDLANYAIFAMMHEEEDRI